ncbi:hypothetical protein J5A66_04770 [Prevotella sp. oral taxon 475]|uniref:di-heme oxidoredictase family protein n=1 Tax=Prevotella sp. oral taxon 475 TaxID=712471 RepID=UPI001BACF5EB|nr:di-heme oxidoredictase family protein [Prevotella sp. oral taxon 475]QUB48088.1 hypothetical protein J5A66_04770 [Prevotella sp. oral taxon 475]
MKSINVRSLLFGGMALAMLSVSCSKDDDIEVLDQDDYKYVGQAVGNFSADEWYPGGELGTTQNTGSTCYQDNTPAIEKADLDNAFNKGEYMFEHYFTEFSPTPILRGLGPAYVRSTCIDCHPGYGHGKRVDNYRARHRGNGYLLVIYHPTGGANSNDGPYISEVTGMPQTQATSPFLPPVDESGISIEWKKVTAMESGLPLTFPDGEPYELIYPEVNIDISAFNTYPKPSNLAFRLESTIGLYGTGLLDAIPQDSIKKQYQHEARFLDLNPGMWDKAKNDWAGDPNLGRSNGAWYRLADGTMRVKRFTYAMTRASLQDGPGANAMWNITNVSRSDRPYLYTTTAWAEAMSRTASVIDAIKKNPASPYYADGTETGIAQAVRTLLDPKTHQFNNAYHNFKPEMTDNNFWQYMVWHRGLAVARARDLHNPVVQRGKQVFMAIGCAHCHRPKWQTGSDDYWAPKAIVDHNLSLPRYPFQTIYPYTDLVQHRLRMKNDIHGSWCRTTPLWGRGLSVKNTGAEDRMHDCRARNEIEAIMWHAYSKEGDAYRSAERFYHLKKADRDALVKFLRAI